MAHEPRSNISAQAGRRVLCGGQRKNGPLRLVPRCLEREAKSGNGSWVRVRSHPLLPLFVLSPALPFRPDQEREEETSLHLISSGDQREGVRVWIRESMMLISDQDQKKGLIECLWW